MQLGKKLEYTVLDLIESAAKNSKTNPLNLGGIAGAGGGVGSPPGGFIGYLPQTRVAYDEDEIASSGIPASGMSLLDNLNHIRYRLEVIESGSLGGLITVIDDNNLLTYTDVDTIHFSGAGIIVTDLGAGDIQVRVDATGTGSGISEAPIDGNTYGRKDAGWIIISGSFTEQPVHIYNEDLTIQIPGRSFTTDFTYASGTLRVYYNGIRQRKGVHYLDDVEFTTFSTYFDTYSGDCIIIDYDYYISGQGDNTLALVDSDGILLVDSDGIQLTESL